MAKRGDDVQDYGEKIGGARKDRWRHRAMTLADLDDLSVEEAAQFVTKDLIWPLPDYQSLIDGGFEPAAAALVKIVRDRIPKSPDLQVNREPRDVHADYIEAVTAVRDTAMASKTVDELRRLANGVMGALGYVWSGDQTRLRQKLRTIVSGRVAPFEVSTGEVSRARKLVDQGFPGKIDPWMKGHAIRAMRDGTYAAVDRIGRIMAEGDTRDEVIEVLRLKWEESRETKKAGPKSPPLYRERLEEIVRSGLPDHRQGRDISSRDFVETFGFRGVEYGTWVSSGERQEVINHAFDALKDLAHVLGLPDRAMSLNGRLAAAFGARGNGVPAHYEPTKKVFNISKLTGAGSLAHEWGHAFDHYCGDIGHEGAGTGQIRSGSGWYKWTVSRVGPLGGAGQDVAGAWDRLMKVMTERTRSNEEEVRLFEELVPATRDLIAREKKRLADHLEEHPRPGSTFAARMQKWLRETAVLLARREARLAQLKANPELPGSRTYTAHKLELQKLCGGKQGYWTRPTEMFARAFECAVFDRIIAMGGRSDFLVEGVEPDRYADPELYKGNPYAFGEERTAITAAVSDVIEAVRPELSRDHELQSEPQPSP